MPFECQHTSWSDGSSKLVLSCSVPISHDIASIPPNDDHNYLRTPSEGLGLVRRKQIVIVFLIPMGVLMRMHSWFIYLILARWWRHHNSAPMTPIERAVELAKFNFNILWIEWYWMERHILWNYTCLFSNLSFSNTFVHTSQSLYLKHDINNSCS